MSTPTSPLEPSTDSLWVYPDDDETNVYTLSPVRLSCDHQGHGAGDPDRDAEARRVTSGSVLPALFEVVADVDKEMTVGDGRSSRVQPDKVFIHCEKEPPITVEGAEALYDDEWGGYTFEAAPLPIEPIPDVLHPENWAGQFRAYKDYPVNRAGQTLTTVRAYNPAEVKVKLSFPPTAREKTSNRTDLTRTDRSLADALSEAQALRGRSGTAAAARSLTRAVATPRARPRTGESASWSPIDNLQQTTRGTVRDNPASSRHETIRGVSVAQTTGQTSTVKVSYNGVDLSASYTEVVRNVEAIGEALIAISKAFKKVPKVGWYIDVEWSRCSGSIELACQMREAEDHRAYLWVGASFDLTIIDGSFECGFGMYWDGILEAVVFVQFSAKAGLGLDLEFGDPIDDPDDPVATIPLTLQATGEIGGKIKVGKSLNGRLSGESGIRLKDAAITLGRDSGLSCGGEVEWMGIKTTATLGLSGEAEIGRDRGNGRARRANAQTPATGMSVETKVDPGAWLRLPQVEPEKLFDWNLTDYQDAVPLTPAEVEEVLRNEFDASFFSRAWDIRVRRMPMAPRPATSAPDPLGLLDSDDRPRVSSKPGDREPIPEWMGPAAVAREVARAAVRHPGFRRRRPEVERLARVVRRALEREFVRSGGPFDLRPEVPYTVFLAFLFGVGDALDPRALSLPRIVADPGRAAVRLGVPAELGAVPGGPGGLPGAVPGTVPAGGVAGAAPPTTGPSGYASAGVPPPPAAA